MQITRNSSILDNLRGALGDDVVLTGEAIPERNRQDAMMQPATLPLALVRPRTTEEVAKVLSLCNAAHQPVTTQGGMTGLAGGAHPGTAEIALSLERMSGVEEVDLVSGTLTALSGTTLQTIQNAAASEGFLCGIDLGARGSCTIGGNVATNAGGNQVLRYGMTRHNVLGLEVVQADGTVVKNLNKMLKNNAGYDWTQLFIGSEGTLGVVTRVVLGLHPPAGERQTALCACNSLDDAMALLRSMERHFGANLLVFEGMWREFIDVAVARLDLAPPFEKPPEITVLLEVAGDHDSLAEALGELHEQEVLSDAILARSGPDAARLWGYRESVYDYSRFQTGFAGFDISVPLPRMAAAAEALREAAAQHWPGAVSVVFGHIADCNLHIMVGAPDGGRWLRDEDRARIDQTVYAIVARHDGSVSAEHGIGTAKKPYLPMSRSAEELALMRTMKRALDPNNILNRGRVL
ncbi:MAG: FAD-binding oxidoreductase [Pseudomonadota bacterium]